MQEDNKTMKVAIVGTTKKLSENEERDMRQFIATILKKYSSDTIIISGGAVGVDTISVEIANQLGFKTEIHNPILSTWSEFKRRNIEIAKECDEIYCFSIPVRKTKCYHHLIPQDHEKTAGCWTASKVTEMSKPSQLIVIPNRRHM